MLKYLDADRTLISFSNADQSIIVVVEKGSQQFDELEVMGPSPYVPIAETDPLEIERAGMVASRFQAKAALLQAGLLDQIEALMRGSKDPLHKLAWTEAFEFRRDSPTIVYLAGQAGISETELDNLFRSAMQIRA